MKRFVFKREEERLMNSRVHPHIEEDPFNLQRTDATFIQLFYSKINLLIFRKKQKINKIIIVSKKNDKTFFESNPFINYVKFEQNKLFVVLQVLFPRLKEGVVICVLFSRLKNGVVF